MADNITSIREKQERLKTVKATLDSYIATAEDENDFMVQSASEKYDELLKEYTADVERLSLYTANHDVSELSLPTLIDVLDDCKACLDDRETESILSFHGALQVTCKTLEEAIHNPIEDKREKAERLRREAAELDKAVASANERHLRDLYSRPLQDSLNILQDKADSILFESAESPADKLTQLLKEYSVLLETSSNIRAVLDNYFAQKVELSFDKKELCYLILYELRHHRPNFAPLPEPTSGRENSTQHCTEWLQNIFRLAGSDLTISKKTLSPKLTAYYNKETEEGWSVPQFIIDIVNSISARYVVGRCDTPIGLKDAYKRKG